MRLATAVLFTVLNDEDSGAQAKLQRSQLNWDVGDHWDSGTHWDHLTLPIAMRRTSMNLFKLLLDFLYWGEARFKDKAEAIVDKMTTEPMLTLVPDASFPAAVPTRAAATTALDNYKASEVAAKDGSKSAIQARNDDRLVLERILAAWAPFLELVAKDADNMDILTNSGFNVRQPTEPVPQPVAAPDLKVSRNGFSGEIHSKCKAVPGALGYEGQLCTGMDTSEANWRNAFFSSGCRDMKFEGLTPGQVYSFRLRALGRDGWGPWSDIAQLMAT